MFNSLKIAYKCSCSCQKVVILLGHFIFVIRHFQVVIVLRNRQPVTNSVTVFSNPTKFTNYPFYLFILIPGNLLVNKTDLYLCGPYCHRTSTRPPSCYTPQELTMYVTDGSVLGQGRLQSYVKDGNWIRLRFTVDSAWDVEETCDMYPHFSVKTLRKNKQSLLKLVLANKQIYFS